MVSPVFDIHLTCKSSTMSSTWLVVEDNFKQVTFEITAGEAGKWEVWIRFTKKEIPDREGKTIEQAHCKFTVIEPASLDRKPHIDTEILQMDLRGAGPIVVPDLPRDCPQIPDPENCPDVDIDN